MSYGGRPAITKTDAVSTQCHCSPTKRCNFLNQSQVGAVTKNIQHYPSEDVFIHLLTAAAVTVQSRTNLFWCMEFP